MTTEHMQYEHNDADEAIVQHTSAPESTVEHDASDATVAEESELSATTPSSEPVAPSDLQNETQEQSPVIETETVTTQTEETDIQATSFEQAPEQHPHVAGSPESVAVMAQDTGSDHSTPQSSEQLPSAETAEAGRDFTFSSQEEIPFVTSKEEEVRPFTSFIEEFRQAEELARLNTALQEAPTETFTLFNGLEEQTQVQFETYEANSQAAATPIDAESSALTAPGVTAHEEETAHMTQSDTASVDAVTPAANTEESEAAANAAPAPSFTRPAVSPLLRPASRIRSSRHSTRHPRTETGNETAVPTQPAATTPTSPLEPQSESATPAPSEAAQSKPARRYRFDRPATTSNTAPVTAQPAPAAPIVPASSEIVTEAVAKAPADPVSSTGALANEPQAPRSFVGTEPGTPTEDTRSAAPTIRENGRRPNGQDRLKESTAPVSNGATEVTGSAPEDSTATEKIAPEDLPPLEYSELQKSTRKRRRHRTTTSNGSTAITPATALAPIAPTAPIAPMVPVQPTTPPAPVAPSEAPAAQAPTAAPNTLNAPYSIVSGYTVSQMNQGNEDSGPFMGPEPSPARGSLITRDTRGVQRPPATSPSYPTRSNEGMASSASFNHLTNMMVQALQTQTDRMVAEMRRANQVPTSVSVSLPPFPSTERVGVFVDVANLLYSARTLRISVDFGKLLDFLRGNRRLVRAHAYCPTSPQAGDEQMFLQAVKGLGYRITTKNYKTFSSGAKKADLDLDLCMDVVRIVDGGAVDCIVLVSGDSDFMPMLDYCSDHGVRVEVAAFDEAMSATLRQSCDLFINLSMLEEIRS